MVTWIKDAVTLPMDMFQIVYDESGERGTTMLTFDPVRRSDSGRYEVQLHNTNTKIQTDKQSARTGVFRLTVQGSCVRVVGVALVLPCSGCGTSPAM